MIMKMLLYKEGRQLYHVSLDCIRDNRGSWNLIMCEKRAARSIQIVEQSGYTKVGRIILTDGSPGRLRKEKVTNTRVGDAQEINRLNGKRIWILLLYIKSSDKIFYVMQEGWTKKKADVKWDQLGRAESILNTWEKIKKKKLVYMSVSKLI